MLNIDAIPIFEDNYVWVLHDGREALVVDPGDASPVRKYLSDAGLALRGILVTHHHIDHIGGVAALVESHRVPVYGPASERARIPGIDFALAEGGFADTAIGAWEVLEVPGHTVGHIAFVREDILLCGDTLFSAGCGRMFEGTPEQFHRSLSRLAALPDQTRVLCTHEYTLSNLRFALAVEPGNSALHSHAKHAQTLRDTGQMTLPSTIGLEKAINPFLRVDQATVREAAERQTGGSLNNETAVFAALRSWKDGFRG